MSLKCHNFAADRQERLNRNDSLSVERLSDLAPLIEKRVRIKVREVLWGDTTLKDAYDVLHSIYGSPVQDLEVPLEQHTRSPREDPRAEHCAEG